MSSTKIRRSSSQNCNFDLKILRESLAECEKTAQERMREGGKNAEIKNLSDLFTFIPQQPEQIVDQQQEEKKLPKKKKSSVTSSQQDSFKVSSKRRPGFARKNTGTAALKAAVENTNFQRASRPFIPPKQLLLYLVKMGSFTSMPKISPAPDADDKDLDYPVEKQTAKQVLDTCQKHLATLPSPIPRSWKKKQQQQQIGSCGNSEEELEGENIRILQWNALSQALGTKNDNFVRCPSKALEWKTRRFRMLEEIVRHEADIICLQEVDHFNFLQSSLKSLGYEGKFFPKPDSPCIYLPDNAGPDGCAIFFKTDKFELDRFEQRVLEVWHVESNQVVLLACLKSKATQENLYVATTHLKARNGALLSTLRNEQGKDILDFIQSHVKDKTKLDQVPIICTGDFNAEPSEPVYSTMTDDNRLRLGSAYTDSQTGKEPDYTTWKVREDGEHKQTLDYIFHSKERVCVNSVLEFPTGSEIGEDRLPNLAYASDHFSLVADMKIMPKKEKKKS